MKHYNEHYINAKAALDTWDAKKRELNTARINLAEAELNLASTKSRIARWADEANAVSKAALPTYINGNEEVLHKTSKVYEAKNLVKMLEESISYLKEQVALEKLKMRQDKEELDHLSGEVKHGC